MKMTLKSKLAVIATITALLFSSCSKAEPDYSNEINGVEHHDIVIIGGGIAGLSCGHYLGNRDFLILEKRNSVGGRAISGVRNNFSYAKGAEYLGDPENRLSKMIKNIGLEPKEIPSPMDAYFDGKTFYYGSNGIERYLINGSSVDEYKRFVNLLIKENEKYDEVPEIKYTNETKELDNTTAKSWLQRNNFKNIYIDKYNVTSRGLFGASLDNISALSFIPEAAFDYDKDDLNNISNDFDIENEYQDALKEESGSYTFTKGLTQLTERLAETMSQKLRLSSNVVEVKKEGKYYIVVYKDKNDSTKIVMANKVVLAVPAPLALKLAPTLISQEKKDLIAQIKFASYATVAMFSKTPIFDKAFDLAVPDDYFFTDIYDATWVEKYYEKKVPETYIISAYIAPHSSDDHSLDKMSDAELMRKVYADLDRIFPGASKKITGYDIEHFPYGYPVMTLGAYERLLKLDKINYGTLLLAGDSMIYPTFESAVESGYLAAERLIDTE
ncbi:FAD-dependent oxidoreductase [Alistipes sp. ZOR0009]|uniref:FAD-dependent oxidoreductase n=1 Tax=Alistipes sp. ZOR0009 TaxID=1339253 RepID=UPI0006479BCB|nr:FAD-dependent oxidoreductase [Alistipes sp. ZOR0009]